MNRTSTAVTPVFHVFHAPAPFLFWMSYARPACFAVPSLIVNVVDVVPLMGDTRIGTRMIPTMDAWTAQW